MPIPTEQPAWTVIDSSKLQDFMTCPRFAFFRHVCGWAHETPNNHLHFGTAWHEAMEYLLLHDYSAESVNAAHAILTTTYRREFSAETDEIFHPKTPDNALVALIGYVQKWPNDHKNYETKYTEIGGTVSIGPNKDLYYRMDSLLQRKSDKLYGSREHKTASSSYLWTDQWPLSFQVGTYNHVLYCLYDQAESYGIEMNGCVFGKSKGPWQKLVHGEPFTGKEKDPREYIRVTIRKNKSQMQAWLNQANWWYDSYMFELETMIDSDDDENDVQHSFQCNTKSCINYGRLCEYYDFCLAWPNPIRKTAQPPIGFTQRFWNPLDELPKHRIDIN